MKTEIKDITNPRGYLLIMYPDNAPSVGYKMTKGDLYALYCELRTLFQDLPLEAFLSRDSFDESVGIASLKPVEE